MRDFGRRAGSRHRINRCPGRSLSAFECLLPKVKATFECPFNVPEEQPKMAGRLPPAMQASLFPDGNDEPTAHLAYGALSALALRYYVALSRFAVPLLPRSPNLPVALERTT